MKSKFKVGDTVYFCYDFDEDYFCNSPEPMNEQDLNTVQKGKVLEVVNSDFMNAPGIIYRIDSDSSDLPTTTENCVFSSEKELKSALICRRLRSLDERIAELEKLKRQTKELAEELGI